MQRENRPKDSCPVFGSFRFFYPATATLELQAAHEL